MNNDLKIIKKKYGEDIMHFCRQSFSTLLEEPGLLPKILLEHFDESRSLYQDILDKNLIDDFKEYIFYIDYVENKRENKREDTKELEPAVTKTPTELLSEAGYDLYECHSEADIQKFKKYYAKGEELCTFDGERLDRCHVFFAVKKDVDNIKRKNFPAPKRQDQYGTSVISIQFDRGTKNRVSIKNRYNHAVENPDSTFSNDLDKIIPGLKKSFEEEYKLSISSIDTGFTDGKFKLPGYIIASDGKNYKISTNSDKYYFCSNNTIIDMKSLQVKKYDKNEFIIFENYILDLKNKKFISLDNTKKDSFIESLKDINKISITKDGDLRRIEIFPRDGITAIIKIDRDNKVVELENQNLKKIDDYFLAEANKLRSLVTPNVEEIGKDAFWEALELESINLPNLKRIGNSSFRHVDNLKEVNLPNVEEIGGNVFWRAPKLESIKLPQVKKIGNRSFHNVDSLQELNLPLVEEIGKLVFEEAVELKNINLPKVKKIGSSSFHDVVSLKELNLPLVEEIGEDSFCQSNDLEKMTLPKLKKIEDYSFSYVPNLREANLPNVEEIGEGVFDEAPKLQRLNVSENAKLILKIKRKIKLNQLRLKALKVFARLHLRGHQEENNNEKTNHSRN